jgi:hypothetical protein
MLELTGFAEEPSYQPDAWDFLREWISNHTDGILADAERPAVLEVIDEAQRAYLTRPITRTKRPPRAATGERPTPTATPTPIPDAASSASPFRDGNRESSRARAHSGGK